MTQTATKTIEGTVIREADSPADRPLAEQPKRVPAGRKVASDPMAILAEMVRQGNVDVDTLDKLTSVAERWRANDAKAAFAADFAEFKKEPVDIRKNASVDYGQGDKRTQYDHATLHQVCDRIIAALGRHNMAHAWRTKNESGKVIVTTVLRHTSGHEEEVTLESAPDASGGKNSIQAIGSAITYLQRYGLIAITGFAVKGQDDDGRGAGDDSEHGLPVKSRIDYGTAIDGAATEESLRDIWQKAAAACFEARDQDAHDELRAKVVARTKALKAKP